MSAGGKAAGVFGAAVIAVPLGLVVVFGSGEQQPVVPTAVDLKEIPAEYREWIERAAKTCKLITAPVLAAQIEAESNWRPDAQSRGPSRVDRQGNTIPGEVIAQGISQFIPSTWQAVGIDGDGDDKADVFNPADAIMSQAKYDCGLAKGIDKRLKAGIIKGDRLELTLAAYNAGTGAVENAGGIPPYPETQNYVRKIKRLISEYTEENGSPGEKSKFGQRIVDAARTQLGVPYSWGGGSTTQPTTGIAQGAGTKGFDCSSLVMYAVYQASQGRITLPRTSQVQATRGKEIERSDMRVGDLIAFKLSGNRYTGYDHIGIYVGNGQMIHAPKTGDVVKISDITDGYYASKDQVIRRIG